MALIDGLRYFDDPPYDAIYDLMRRAITALGFTEQDEFDWQKAN